MPETHPPAGGQNQSPPNNVPLLSKERLGEVKPHHIPRSLAFGIIIVLSIAVGYLVWAKSHTAWPYDNTDLNAPLFGNTGDRSNSDLAGWKTYRNEEYGFEFKYPIFWSIREVLEGGPREDPHINIFTNENEEEYFEIDLKLLIHPSEPFDEQFVRARASEVVGFAEIQSIDQITSSPNLDSFIVTREYVPVPDEPKSQRGEKLYCLDAFLFDKHQPIIFAGYKTYERAIYGCREDSLEQSEIELFTQFVNSFKFIQLPNDTKWWQAYHNEEYGFEVKYPIGWDIREDAITSDSGWIFLLSHTSHGEVRFDVAPVNIAPHRKTPPFPFPPPSNLSTFQGKKAYIHIDCPERDPCEEKVAYSKSIRFVDLPEGWDVDNEIEFTIFEGFEYYYPEVDKILSTFKFIE